MRTASRKDQRPSGYQKDLNLNVAKYDDLTEEQLIARLRTLTMQGEQLIGRLINQDNDETAPEAFQH